MSRPDSSQTITAKPRQPGTRVTLSRGLVILLLVLLAQAIATYVFLLAIGNEGMLALLTKNSIPQNFIVFQLTMSALVLSVLGIVLYRERRQKLRSLPSIVASSSNDNTEYQCADKTHGEIEQQPNQIRHARSRLDLIDKIFQASPDGLVILSQDLQVIDVNQTFVDVNGYSRDELIGKPFAFLTHEISEQSRMSMIEEATNQGFSRREVWARTADGRRLRKQLKLVPILDGEQLSHYYTVESDVTEAYFKRLQLKSMASTDALTGLRNRRQFELDLGRLELTKSGCYGLAIIDLDGLKEINNTYGNFVGDLVIEAAAKRLRNHLYGDEHMIYRLSSDEFCVILKNPQTRDELDRICRSMRAAVEGRVEIDQISTELTIGLGASLFDPARHSSIQALAKESDIALKEAKSRGHSSLFISSPETLHTRERKTNLSLALKSPSLESQVQIAYLPKVDIQNNILSGAEALIRWTSPDFGFIRNEEFIPIAEETGDILKIDEWVINRATEDAGLFSKIINGFQTTINLSPRQLFRQDFVERLIKQLESNQVDAENFSIEITEWTAIQNYEKFVPIIHSLRAAGISLELDDFGTGHSSLVNLHKLPVDALKIDRDFVRTMTDNNVSLEIVRSIITLARSLNMTVVAEGVENLHQLDKLRELGCEYCQGYLYSEPVVIESEANLRAAVSQWQQAVSMLS